MMSMTLDELKIQAMKLSAEDRVRLADELYASADDREVQIDREDIAEAQRRYAELRSGAVRGESAEEVFAALHAPLE